MKRTGGVQASVGHIHFCYGSTEDTLFFFTLVTGPGRSLRLKLSDTRVYEPQIRARLGTTTPAWLSGGYDSGHWVD